MRWEIAQKIELLCALVALKTIIVGIDVMSVCFHVRLDNMAKLF